jgi:SAM-dependent methyltransferase
MNGRCAVCGSRFGDPIYKSGPRSLTSLCQVVPVAVEVHVCASCAHVQTREVLDTASFYAEDYTFLVSEEEEDQLYEIRDGQKVFRMPHQAETFLHKVNPGLGASLLDYGSGKGGTTRLILKTRPDIQAHAFDVSDMYEPFWAQFLQEGHWATHQCPEAWNERFDVITSYFALEHVQEPVAALQQMRRLLKPGGVLYAIVPDVLTNTADLVVVDHLNHYTETSLRVLFSQAGFQVREIDAGAHVSALVVVAEKRDGVGSFTLDPGSLIQVQKQISEMGDFWQGLAMRVQAFEAEQGDRNAAIYGSGFYGSYLATCLQNLDLITAFLDRNPSRQSQKLMDKPILDPSALHSEIEVIYVGLNPRQAKSAIASVPGWEHRSFRAFFP